jgi:hypothetical protein
MGSPETAGTLEAGSDQMASTELPEGRVGAAAEQGDRGPAVAGGDRAVRAEALAERRELLALGGGSILHAEP